MLSTILISLLLMLAIGIVLGVALGVSAKSGDIPLGIDPGQVPLSEKQTHKQHQVFAAPIKQSRVS